MCFSATASFTSSVVLGALGVSTLRKAPKIEDKLLATMPLVFAAQQLIEGLLWLTLKPLPGTEMLAFKASTLTYFYSFFAYILWPTYASLAVTLVEPLHSRKKWMKILTVGGVITSFYFAWILSQAPPVSWIGENHLEYAHGISSSVAVSTLYLLSTVFTCFLSSDRWIKNFGKAVLVALMLTRLFYQEALVSVWCFFAAILSMILYFHFSSKEQVLLHQRQVA